jgi:Rab-GTPase-TBC domain
MERIPRNTRRRTSSVGSNILAYLDEKLIHAHKPQCSCVKIGLFLKKNCKNGCRQKFPDSCPKAHKWCHKTRVPPNREELYNQLQLISIESETYTKYVQQIENDLKRTFPDVEYFTTGKGVDAMRRVLAAFVKYHYQLGYVQGMNYIVCSLLWHASEVDAFWLLLVIIDEYKLRENYLYRFPGLTKHCEITEHLLSLYLPNLHTHFNDNLLMVQMFATDWYLTLFTSLVPIQVSGKTIGYFIKFGWVFLYKLCITILERLESKLLACDRISMLGIIKPMELVNNDWDKFLMSLQKKKEKLTWEKLLTVSAKKNIDPRHIDTFLRTYNQEFFE